MNTGTRSELKRATARAQQYASFFAGFVDDEKPDAGLLADAAEELQQRAGKLAALARMTSGRGA